jgi:hypothetical protein
MVPRVYISRTVTFPDQRPDHHGNQEAAKPKTALAGPGPPCTAPRAAQATAHGSLDLQAPGAHTPLRPADGLCAMATEWRTRSVVAPSRGGGITTGGLWSVEMHGLRCRETVVLRSVCDRT